MLGGRVGVSPGDLRTQLGDQRRGGGNARPHHDRVLNETADEHAPRSEKALELRANPMRRRDLRVLGVRPRIGHDGFRIVAASFVGGKIGRQAQGKIWAWRWTDRTSRVGRSEEHTSELQSLMRISYAVF